MTHVTHLTGRHIPMKLNTVRRGAAAAAVLTLSLTLAACGEDDTTTPATSGSDSDSSAPAEAPEGTAADPQAQTFGPACDQVPTEGDGSFVGMSDSPVATAAGANPLLEQLVGAVGAVNGLGDTLNGAPELTVFAPYNDAFEAIDADALAGLVDEAKADKSGTDSALYTVLANHVVGANLDADAIVGTQDSLAGTELTIEGDAESGMTVNDGTVTANVLCGNIPTANATVYVIDAVLAGPIS